MELLKLKAAQWEDKISPKNFFSGCEKKTYGNQ
jgi:hypothetical protein